MAQHFHDLFKRAGIAGASSHSMRRSFITNLATKGIGVRVLASLAGHRSIAVTQKYTDVNDDMMRNAVELSWLSLRLKNIRLLKFIQILI